MGDEDATRLEIAALEKQLAALNSKLAVQQETLDSARASGPPAEEDLEAEAEEDEDEEDEDQSHGTDEAGAKKTKKKKRGGKKKRKAEKLAGNDENVAPTAESSEVAYARSEVQLCPRNAQCRHDLAVALERAGELRRAYAEARAATTLTRTYGRAWKTRARLEAALDAASIPRDDDDATFLEGSIEEKTNGAEAAPRVQTAEEAAQVAAARKAAGNAHFVAKRNAEAVTCWTEAIETLTAFGLPVDAKLYSNRSAAYLQLGRNVLAATDARKSAESDPTWWKAHWYLGQALSAQLQNAAKQRGACTSNGERAQEAYRAISTCADSPTLPDAKRPEVLAYKDKMQAKIYEMTDQGACALM